MNYEKVVVGSHVKDNYTRFWLAGTQKEIVQRLEDKGFKIVTKRPRAEAAEKAPAKAKAKKTAKNVIKDALKTATAAAA